MLKRFLQRNLLTPRTSRPFSSNILSNDFTNDDYIKYLKDSLVKNGMICIRNQNLSFDQLEDLLWKSGKPIIMPDSLKFHKSHLPNPFILDISNVDLKTGEVVDCHDAAEYWHSDNAFMQGEDARYNLT